MRFTRIASVAAIAASAFITSPVFAQRPNAALIERPGLTISAPARGRAALTALGARLPAVAARYGRTEADLRAAFLRDLDLAVDRDTRLLYLCDGMAVQEQGMIG